MSKSRRVISPFEWILNRNRKTYAESMVVGLVGPKRGGKSLTMAKLGHRDMSLGRPVWSNLPIQTPKFLLDKGYPLLKTREIDWNAFFMMDPEYQDGTILLDEASYMNSNRGWNSMKNRVTNAFLNQVGHRNLDVIWNAKSTGWLDGQGLGFETDVEIYCKDLGKTPWGWKNHVTHGTIISFEAYDRTGSLTGRIANRRDRYARPFRKWFTVNQYIWWTAYDTRHLSTLEEIFGGLKLDLQQRIISNKQRVDSEFIDVISEIAGQMATESENTMIKCDDVRNTIRKVGFSDVSDKVIGQALRQVGISYVRKNNIGMYDFSEFQK